MGDATDTCKYARARVKNYLTYVFQMIKTIFAKASLGFVANPLLDAIQTFVNGFLTATNIDPSGPATTAVEMMYLLKFIAPDSYKDEIQTYIDRICAFQAAVQECTGKKDCMGPISFMVIVLKVPAGFVDSTLSRDTLIHSDVFRETRSVP